MRITETERPSPSPRIEVWGGVECTVNRVGEQYFDQLARNGHAVRASDLERFARLGLRTLRYPMLWERIAPEGVDTADWSWADERMEMLRSLGIRPIVGLLHHGSGPRYTSLIDPEMPKKLAAFARAFAERYPWVDHYTPINEPLTTARFSALYGLWYPHREENPHFALAQIHQCQGIVRAMQEIRRVNPEARLVQTEDLGKVYSTPLLSYQAEMENERRWLTYDLLCGRVDRDHPMREYYFADLGREEARLDWLIENAAPPDIIGVNHYLTSERFLDERVDRYPEHARGGNGIHEYADVEAVRVLANGTAGPGTLLTEAWERYRLSLAVTEVHLGCTREEQMRWLKEVWDSARQLADSGVDIRAVTAWSLLGAYDWHCLLTRDDGRYEPGVFDLRSPEPRPTGLARMIVDMAAGREPRHPVLRGAGWWRRRIRLVYPPSHDYPGSTFRLAPRVAEGDPQPLLVVGRSGTLGRAFERACRLRGIHAVMLGRGEMDIADPASVEAAVERYRPWGIVNAAGFVRVDEAERESERCRRENTLGPATLAEISRQRELKLVTFSSDLVFDGTGTRPYVESDPVSPLNVYGRTKAEAEQRVLDTDPSALVVRTSAFFGPWDEYNFVTIVLRMLAAGEQLVAAEDLTVSPTYVPDLVSGVLDLMIDGESGIWHLANRGEISWYDLARRTAELAGFPTAGIKARPAKLLDQEAPRPRYSVLASERGAIMPTLDDALERYIAERWMIHPVTAAVPA